MSDFLGEHKSQNETVARALQLLMLFRDESELGLRELARRLDLSPSVVHRIATTLCDFRFLQQIPESKKYALGSTPVILAARFREEDRFAQTCIRHMDALRDATSETVAFHAYHNGLRVCALESQSPHPLRHVMRQGTTLPIGAGASDTIIRATVSEADLKLIEQFFEASPVPLRRPGKKQFEFFREHGWISSDGARSPGAMAVAAPVPHPEAIYVLSVLGPRERILEMGREHLAELVLATAADLARDLRPLHASL